MIQHRIFASTLLAAWRAAGHPVGVDSHVRVLELLQKLPPHTEPEALKTLLAPLFAANAEQQTAFYGLFARLLPDYQRQLARERQQRRALRVATGIVAALLLGLGVWWWMQQRPNTTPTDNTKPLTETTDTANTGNQPVDPGNVITDPPESQPARDTLAYKPFDHRPDISSLKPERIPLFSWKFGYWEPGKITLLLAWLALLLGIGWWLNRRRHRRELEAHEKQRNLDTRATDLTRAPNDKPPFTWQLRLPKTADIAADNDLGTIAPRLRSRSAAEWQLLDGPRTVKATVQNAGRISFRYRQPTQPDEYLLLIDARSANDHRARLFDAIYEYLRRNEVLIERYYYRTDPRFCWSEQPGSALSLRDLHQKYPRHRLVMTGSGAALISPVTGELQSWAISLEQWRFRTLLTPRPPAQWGADEAQLSTLMRLAPASLEGLADVVNNIDAEESPDLNRWRKRPDQGTAPIELPDRLRPDAIMANLEAEYTDYHQGRTDQRLLCWLAATALSPVLHWDATLFFAEQVEQRHDPTLLPLLTPLNLQRLCRLPWFAAGRMPDNARRALLDWLRTEQPELLEHLRGHWKQLLEQNLEQLRREAADKGAAPFEETAAYEQLRLTMLVNELALDALRPQLQPPQRRQLERELRALAQHTEPDLVALELLENAEAREAQTTATDYEEAPPPPMPVWWAHWGWQLPAALLACGLLWMYNNKGVDCAGTAVVYQNNRYCIASPADQVLLHEYLLCDTLGDHPAYAGFLTLQALNAQSEDAATAYRDSLLRQAQALIRAHNLDSTSFYKNTAIALWNAGAMHYNRSTHLSSLISHLSNDSACIFFKALTHWPLRDSVLTPAEVSWMQQLCTPKRDTTAKAAPIAALPEHRYTLTVTDAANGQPLPEATLSSLAAGVNITATRAIGRYIATQPGNRPPTLRLLARCTGYVDSSFVLRPGDYILPLRRTTAPARSYVLTGRVEDAAGKPMDGVRITSPYAAATSDANGNYRLTLPAANNYPAETTLELVKEGYYTVITPPVTLPNSGGAVTVRLFKLNPLPPQDKINPSDKTSDGTPPTRENVGGVQNPADVTTADVTTPDVKDNAFLRRRYRCLSTAFYSFVDSAAVILRNDPEVNLTIVYSISRSRDGAAEEGAKKEANGFRDRLFKNKISRNRIDITVEYNNGDKKGDGICYFELVFYKKNSIPPPDMIRVPGGTFTMGCTSEQQDCDYDEKPTRQVTLSSFWMANNELTFEEYDAFCDATKRDKPYDEGWGRGKRPVINVSWNDAVAYCNWRSQQEGLTPCYTINGNSTTCNWQAKGYRLPTEAEWEYAARGGGKAVLFGNGKNTIDPAAINFNASANYKKPYSVVGEYRRISVPVGSLNSPNALGLHDMSGNVSEWCWDRKADYPSNAESNPRGPASGSIRVVRGGSWDFVPQYCRVADRYNFSPGNRGSYMGFRLARTL